MSPRPRKILFVASECLPYAKAGGLADVVAALPKALARDGHDVRVLMPLYASIDRTRFGLERFASLCVHMGGGEEAWASLWRAVAPGEVPVYFVEYQRFFDRPGIYHDGQEYGDNAFRFALLSKAALQLAVDLGFVPEVMHLHDWPTALTAAYLGHLDPAHGALAGTASVLTVHNVEYQGKFPADALGYIGLGEEVFEPDRLEDNGGLNLLKCGVACADALTTVSPTHAREMLDPVGGHGLSPFLERRAGVTTGILNGVDDEVWNPEADPLIPARFGLDRMRGKLECKQALQRRLGLEPRADAPLFGIVSRFAPQKGLGLLRDALPRVLARTPAQLAVLGSGDAALEAFFCGLAASHPGRAAASVGYSEELAHLIEAGADFFLMPSLYEPCGLNQMYSLRYGTLPVVRATGGLADTVVDYDPEAGSGTGFVFREPVPGAAGAAIDRALQAWYRRPSHVARMRRAGMALRFPWSDAARCYAAVYEAAIEAHRGPASQAASRAPAARRTSHAMRGRSPGLRSDLLRRH